MTFLFTDIEGSTRIFERLGERYRDLLARHDAVLTHALTTQDGVVVKKEGDALFVAFPDAESAVTGCLQAQRALLAEPWPDVPVRVRMGLDTGYAEPAGGDYVALAVHRAARISAAAHGGQVLVSEATAEHDRAHLPPGAALIGLGPFQLRGFEAPCVLFELRHPDLPSAFPLPPSSARHNLHPPRTSLVDRQSERAELTDLLMTNRLVCVTGPGGVGKTRLASAVAQECTATFPDGVWLVELAPVSRDAGVAPAVARAVSPTSASQDDVTSVCEHLADAAVLLVLDNCEHVVSGAASVADAVLGSCPGVRLLATSRAPLGVYGEAVLRLQPLPMPAPSEPVASDAVRLFEERARLVRRGFAVTAANMDDVVSICRQLDGLPLAIELAAGRVGTLQPGDIRRQLEGRAGMVARLGSGEGRQSNLSDLVAWSHGLLAPAEQVCFRRLACFNGGFTLESAQAVIEGQGISVDDVVEAVLSLVGHSLVELGGAGDAPYRMLETIRAYARDQLVAAGELATVERRHGDWYVELAELAAPELHGRDQVRWFERLRQEGGNLETALERAVERSEDDALVRLAIALAHFWLTSGRLRDADRWLPAALDRAARDPDRARLLLDISEAAMGLGEVERAHNAAEAAERLGEVTGDPWIASRAKCWRSQVAKMRDDLDGAADLAREAAEAASRSDHLAVAAARAATASVLERRGAYEELLAVRREVAAIHRTVGDVGGLGVALHDLAVAAGMNGDLSSARTTMTEALDLLEEVGNRALSAQALSNLAYLYRTDGELDAARSLVEDSVALVRETGNQSKVAFALNNLAEVALDLGDRDAAVAAYREALQIAVRLGDSERACFCLDGLAVIAGREGSLARAVRLVSATDAARRRNRVALPAPYQAANENLLIDARETLGPDVFAREWSVGEGLSLAEASDLAITA